uniref:PLAC8 family protein n=1 Tax=Trypanosoma congolense (strain IL3000) TaxID=1068625 RepID=G0UMV4_TRYCI|nr:conserved hypothetical protein [Trypanosoma congolense IL3000]
MESVREVEDNNQVEQPEAQRPMRPNQDQEAGGTVQSVFSENEAGGGAWRPPSIFEPNNDTAVEPPGQGRAQRQPGRAEEGQRLNSVDWDSSPTAGSPSRRHRARGSRNKGQQRSSLLLTRERSEYYTRPRLTVTTYPRIVTAPMLDRPDFDQQLCSLCFFLKEAERAGSTDEEMASFREHLPSQGKDHRPGPTRKSRVPSVCEYFWWRMCCLRCSIADQTRLLAIEEDVRRYEPLTFLCECFYGDKTAVSRAVWTMCICDLLTGGCPCGCFYHGLGTTLYGCRLRYFVRCRYRVKGFVSTDFLYMLCCPLLSVDQQGSEMRNNGLIETRSVCKLMS